MAFAIFFSKILPSMAAKAMDIIQDKGLAIGRYIADKTVDKAMDMVMAIEVDKVDGIINIERDISKLQTTLFVIKSIVPVAEEMQIDDDFIRNWLHDLVDIAYEARDVLDDFNTFSSCIIRAEETSNPVNFISSFMLSYVGGLSSDTLPLTVLNRLEKDIRTVRERFDKKKEGETFATLKSVVGEGSESVKTRRPEVGRYINKESNGRILGREEVKKGIMKKIRDPKYDRVDVVVIWGMGGIGKTTLAQSIYNDKSVKTVPRRWSCVGESKFCALKVITKIIGDSSTNDVESLQDKLVEKFLGDRFLIVLDDVWDVDDNEWDLLFNPLTEVGKGGMIIITTRKGQLCDEIINTKEMVAYNLEPLSEEDSWSIFESYAYVKGSSDSTPDLKDIGKKIVKKLNGLPLALKVVGRSLLCKDYNTWTKFLEFKFSEDDKVMSALRWSYNHLPPHLKTCFTYCALFPKDHVLDKKILVQMWMAHDLIGKKKQERPEDVGAQYFEELVNASMFQCVDGKHVMHDLIHDLAQLVSNGEFATANDSLTNDQVKKVRHITSTRGDYSKNPRLWKIEKLVTLYTTDDKIYTTEKFDYSILDDDVFNQLKSIRVLVLCNDGIKEIPKCISELRHLRYLDVSETCVSSLPDSLCHLYNLQMLAAPLHAILPGNIVYMANLRHLRANLSTCKGVGKLTSLQELSSIHVCEGDNIRELGDMQELRGKLRINGLGNNKKLEDVAGALMEKQTSMDELELEFDKDSAEPTISAQVLDVLGCPPKLTYLRIIGYKGVKPPSWMVDGKHKFDKLQTLELEDCPKLESLPGLRELISLKHLSLRSLYGVKRLGDEFYGKITDGKVFRSLESLSFSYMKEWEEWDDRIFKNSSVSFFPRLTRLKLSNCPKLESLPPLEDWTSLKDLDLWNVGVKRLGNEFYEKNTDGKVFFPSLKSLSFYEMKEWEKWNDITIENSSVTRLQLLSCPKLESLPPLGELTSLKDLSLKSVGVKRLGDEFYGKLTDGKVFRSLESLSFSYMKEWEEWDDRIFKNSSVSFFPRLTRLKLEGCPKLESLPPLGELTSLKYLSLWDVGVKRLGDEFYGNFTNGKVLFPSLESLSFSDMKEWEEWDDSIFKNSSVSFFTRLTRLKLEDCPKLESLPPLGELTSLKDLDLSKVGVKRLGNEFYGKFTDGKVFFQSLKSLSFSEMNEWEKWNDIIIENSNVSFFRHLTTLNLDGCPKLESLTPLGELTSLKDLSLESVGIKRLGDEFYGKLTNGKVFFRSLESLSFSYMKEWEEWDDSIFKNSSVSFFTRLTRLKLEDCPKLESLPPLGELTSLKDLSLESVGVKRLGDEFYGKNTDRKVVFPYLESLSFSYMKEWEEWDDIIIENSSVSFFPCLTTLKLSNCPKLEYLPPLGELTSLKDLSLESVGVKRLGDEFYRKFTDRKVFFPCLESLRFSFMREWKEWDDIIIENSSVSFFPRLTRLEIYRCAKLVSVLPVVKNPIMNAANFMTSLSSLKIYDCPKLQSLPADGFPPSLTYLKLEGCPLLYERCKDESGLDWHKINHIPERDIYS